MKPTTKESPIVESAKAVAAAKHELELANADFKKKDGATDVARERVKKATHALDETLNNHSALVKKI